MVETGVAATVMDASSSLPKPRLPTFFSFFPSHSLSFSFSLSFSLVTVSFWPYFSSSFFFFFFKP